MFPITSKSSIRNPNRSLVSTQVGTWASSSPLSFAPGLWLDASDTATITSSAGKVSQWADKSGNGRNAVQNTGSLQPTTGSQTQNGLNVLSFSTNTLTVSYQLNFNSLTVCVVALKTSAGTGSHVFSRVCSAGNTADGGASDYVNTNGCIFVMYPASSFGGFNPSSGCYRNSTFITGSGYTYNTASVSTFALTGGEVLYRHNGVQSAGSTSTTTLNANQILIGNNATNLDCYLNGWIGEMVIIPRTLSLVEIGLLEKYLKDKWATV